MNIELPSWQFKCRLEDGVNVISTAVKELSANEVADQPPLSSFVDTAVTVAVPSDQLHVRFSGVCRHIRRLTDSVRAVVRRRPCPSGHQFRRVPTVRRRTPVFITPSVRGLLIKYVRFPTTVCYDVWPRQCRLGVCSASSVSIRRRPYPRPFVIWSPRRRFRDIYAQGRPASKKRSSLLARLCSRRQRRL